MNSIIEQSNSLPEYWNVKKAKFIFNIYNGDSLKDTEKAVLESSDRLGLPYISTKDIDLETSKINYENGLWIPIEEKNYKIAPNESSLLCIEGGSAGRKIGFVNRDVCFVNKLACFQIASENNPRFLFYYLNSQPFKAQFQLAITGLIGGVAISLIKNFGYC